MRKRCKDCDWWQICEDTIKHRNYNVCGIFLLGIPQKYFTRFNNCEYFRERKEEENGNQGK